MWRTLRGVEKRIRNAFVRGSYKNRAESSPNAESIKKLLPVLRRTSPRGNSNFCGSCSNSHDWLDVINWSGVILLGWFMCQPCRKRIRLNPVEQYVHATVQEAELPYSVVVDCFTRLVLSSSSVNTRVLPSVQAVKSTSQEGSNSKTQLDEIVKVGCENLTSAHKHVTVALKNFLGTECMQRGQHKEAFSHFLEAAQAEHSPAIFNLGICYEMGLGTKQCFIKAAEMYKKGAELGHATAMYNLGVFYVHGWGGLTPDREKAQRLFLQAADLGQGDARRALDLEAPLSSTEEQENSVDLTAEPSPNDLTKNWFKILNVNLAGLPSSDEALTKHSPSSSNDSGINDSIISLSENIDHLRVS